jgi:hypothetical protein
MFVVNRFPKITNNAVVQSAGSISVIGVGSNENHGNRVPGIDEVSIKFDPAHRRHIDISDYAGCFTQTRRSQEIGRRRETLDCIALGFYQPSHRIAKELIILNDRYE